MFTALNNPSMLINRLCARGRLALVLFVSALCLAATTPAQAITLIRSIDGVETGDSVSSDLLITAKATGDTNAIYYKLTGPVELEVVRSGKSTSFMEDDKGNPVAWDTTTVPDGLYKLVVYAMRNGEIDRFKSVQFRIQNLTGNTQTSTVQDSPAQEPETEEPTTEEPATEEPATEEPATTEESSTQQPATAPEEQEPTLNEPDTTITDDTTAAEEPATEVPVVVDPVPQPTPQALPFTAHFGTDARTYQLGSGKPIPLVTTGTPGSNETLLVLAWSVKEQRMVTEFAFSSTEGPWEIPASQIEKLPSGVNNIQLIVRDGTRTVSRALDDFEFIAPKIPFVASFVNAPASYELGSKQSIKLATTGELAEGEDVLVLAWSDAKGALVDAFAQSLDGSPWEIPASKLDQLPEGEIELQLIARTSNETKVTHRMTVSAPAPVVPDVTVPASTSFTQGQAGDLTISLSAAMPAGYELVATAWSVAEQRMVAEFEHPLSITAPVVAADKLALLPLGQNELRVQVRNGNDVLSQATGQVTVEAAPEPEPVVEPVAQFAAAPATYTTGSGDAINFAVQELPVGGDVLILAWSDAQGGLVESFGHYLKQGPWAISAEKMDLLPAGKVELQLIIRGGDTRPKFTHRLTVQDPATSDPTTDPDADLDTTNPTPDPDSGSDPTTDPAEQPVAEEPVTEEPVTEEPVADEPVAEEPVAEEPAPEPDTTTPDLSATTIGFTKLVKHADTQVIYVSSSEGSDNNDGKSESRPVKTLAKGISLTRHSSPDWLLLKSGDVWEGEYFEFNRGGAGADKPLVISSYGEGDRPMIIPPDGKHGLKTLNQYINGLVIKGLHFYAATRDPGSPKYVSRTAEADGMNIRINATEGRYIKGLLIEDCKISHFDSNIKIADDWARNQGEGIPGRIEVAIRRNIIRYGSGADSHSIGIYIEGTRDSVIEQNLIDHNGWAQTDDVSHRNKRSHNIYAQRFNGPIIVRDNILARGAAHGLQLRAGGTIERNLFVRNALAFWTAINDSKANYNVVIESDDMNPDVATERRGVGIEGWDMENYEVIGNVVARRVGSLQRPGISVNANNVTVKNNTVYDWQDERTAESIVVYGSNKTVSGNLAKELYGGKEPPFVDPMRSVDTYAGTIGLEASLEAFLDAAADRPGGQWIEELSPEAVCRYIRNGFDLLPHD